MHLKRNKIPKTWPLPRKGTKYLVVPNHGIRQGIPLLVVLRDVLKIVQNKAESRRILNEGRVQINSKKVVDEKTPVMLIDVLTLGDKNYRMIFKNKKFKLNPIDEKEGGEKIARIIGKKMMKKGKIQANLGDGRNLLINENVRTGDSVLINLRDNKMKKIIEMKKGCRIFIINGKYIGQEGILEEMDKEKKMGTVEFENGKVNLRLKDLIVIQ